MRKEKFPRGRKDLEQKDESRKQQNAIIIISIANSPFLIQRKSEQKHERVRDKSQIWSVMLTPSCTDLCKKFSKLHRFMQKVLKVTEESPSVRGV